MRDKTKHNKTDKTFLYMIQKWELTVQNHAQKVYYFITEVLEGKSFLVNGKCLRKKIIKKKKNPILYSDEIV